MMISTEILLLTGSVLFFISMLVGKAGHRFGVPVLLLFLLVGVIFGSDGFGLMFQNVQTAHTIGTLSLYHPLLRRSGYPFLRHPAGDRAGGGAGCTGVSHCDHHRFVHLVDFRIDVPLSRHWSAHCIAACINRLIYRLGFGLRYPPLKGVVLKNNLRPMLEMESGSNGRWLTC